MAGAQRTALDPVIGGESPEGVAARDAILANAKSYDFFVTVGMIERLFPEAARIGGEGPYAREPVRFRHDPSLVFNTADVSTIAWREVPRSAEDALSPKRHRFEITTTFLGLSGAASPLPLYLSEEIAQAQDTDLIRREFLDIFHHRLVSFVFRIGVKFDIAREHATDGSDEWSKRLLATCGLDAWSRRRPKHIPLWRLLRLAPVLGSQVRSARAIEVALKDLCGEAIGDATVEVLQFAGGWVPLDADQRTLLQNRNSVLGRSSVLGVQCYHRGGKAVVVIGPLHENFRRFLQDGDMYPAVCELLGMMVNEPIEFELDLVLAEHARPPFLLGVDAGGKLGTDSWLSSRAGAAKETHLRVPVAIEQRSDPAVTWPEDRAQPV